MEGFQHRAIPALGWIVGAVAMLALAGCGNILSSSGGGGAAGTFNLTASPTCNITRNISTLSGTCTIAYSGAATSIEVIISPDIDVVGAVTGSPATISISGFPFSSTGTHAINEVDLADYDLNTFVGTGKESIWIRLASTDTTYTVTNLTVTNGVPAPTGAPAGTGVNVGMTTY